MFVSSLQWWRAALLAGCAYGREGASPHHFYWAAGDLLGACVGKEVAEGGKSVKAVVGRRVFER